MKFSFILPAYKSIYLAESLDSILNQSISDFEVIIINDCSPFDVENIVKGYKDLRIRYYENKENVGSYNLVENWNKGLKLAQGKYIIFASDDDRYHRDYLYYMNRLILDNPESSIFHCRIEIIDGKGKRLAISKKRNVNEGFREHFLNRVVNRDIQVLHEFIVEKEKILAFNGLVSFPLAWYSDDATWIGLSLECKKSYTSKVLFSWRYSGENISSRYDRTKLKIIASELYRERVAKVLKVAEQRKLITAIESRQMERAANESILRQRAYDITDTRGLSWLILTFREKSFLMIMSLVYQKVKRVIKLYLQ